MKQIKMKEPLRYYQSMMAPYTIRIEYCSVLDKVFLVVTSDFGRFITHTLTGEEVSAYRGDLVKYWLLQMKTELDNILKESISKKTLLKGDYK